MEEVHRRSELLLEGSEDAGELRLVLRGEVFLFKGTRIISTSVTPRDDARVRLVPIGTIRVPRDRKRGVVEHVVEDLAESIAAVGLLEPIVVTSEGRLVAGLHRLLAHRKLRRSKILARVLSAGSLEVELAEIDENLIRAELSVLEQGEHLRRRKEIYEDLYPQTAHGVAGGLAGGRGRHGAQQANDRSPAIPSFALDAGRRLGVSERHVQQAVQIGGIVDAAKRILRATTLADNRTALLRVARAPEREQVRVVRELLAPGRANGRDDDRSTATPPDLVYAALVGNSAAIFPDILRLHVPRGSVVADVTFGRGVFWDRIPKGAYKVLASDLATGTDCRLLPYADRSVDCVVLDPPYMHSPGGTAHEGRGFEEAYRNNSACAPAGTKWHEAVLALYEAAGKEAARVLRNPGGIVILKCQDEVCAGLFRATHVEILVIYERLGFFCDDLFALVSPLAPTVSRLRRQVHSRRNFSYFLVLRNGPRRRRP